jgi:hypothetical protein
MHLSNTFWNSPEIIQQEEAEVNALISKFWAKNVDSTLNKWFILNPAVQQIEQRFNDELISKFWPNALTQ